MLLWIISKLLAMSKGEHLAAIESLPMLCRHDDFGNVISVAIHRHAPFEHIIKRAATTHQVDPDLIKAIIMAESRYNPKAVSKRGARGLMQLMPVTAKSLGVEDSFDPEDNINGGVMYFKKMLDRFDGDIELALAAYNAGSRYVRKYGGVPPFRQTKTYIKKVFKYHRRYKQEVEA